MGFRESAGGGGRVARVRGRTFIKNDCEYIMREFLGYWKLLFGRKMETTQFSLPGAVCSGSLCYVSRLTGGYVDIRALLRVTFRRERTDKSGEIDIRSAKISTRRDATRRDNANVSGEIRVPSRVPRVAVDC